MSFWKWYPSNVIAICETKFCRNFKCCISSFRALRFGYVASLVRFDVEKFEQYLDFQVTRPCVRSFYYHMEISHCEILDKLILNPHQTSSKFVAASQVTMTEEGSNHVSVTEGTDKRCITLTVMESISGQLLPLQVIHKGKMERFVPLKA